MPHAAALPRRRPSLARAATLALATLCATLGVAHAAGKPPTTVTATPVVRVQGNRLVDAGGNTVQLRGASMSGLEYVPVQGWSAGNPWGGPAGDARPDFERMRQWGMNVLRIPLNEASWLGYQCTDETGKSRDPDPGHNYRQAVDAAVREAGQKGFYIIIDLHWTAPGRHCPFAQNPRPDADNSPAFWTSLGQAYGKNPGVLFELFNEPFEDLFDGHPNAWQVLRDGGDMAAFLTGGNTYKARERWRSAGLQQLLDAVRATGATNVVLASGVYWSKDLSRWTDFHPVDPLGQLAASWHAYAKDTRPGSADATLPDFGQQAYRNAEAILAAGFPLVITELGDRAVRGTQGAPFVSRLLPWADAHGASYVGWTWNPFGTDDNALVQDAKGTPTDGFGAYFQKHLQCRAGGAATCP